MRLRTLVSGLALMGLSISGSGAEVSAKLNEDGEYVGMVFKYGGGANRRVWGNALPTAQRRPLNPTGDLLGDLAPTVVENPVHSYWPTAIWSHPNGSDYDLVFSRWTGSAWSPIQFVQGDNFYNDLEPRLAFNSVGRPYLVWWVEENGVGAVYFSIFLETRWLTGVRVSTPGVDARRANLVIDSDLRVIVSYDVREMRQMRTVTMPNRDSITDDIDPKFRYEIMIF